MIRKLTLAAIRTDGGTQVRVELDQETFLDYGRQMAAGVKFPPVDVFFDGSTYWLADGFHRFYGARESRLLCIDAKVLNGTVRDAILFAIGANTTHGKPRTNKDKRHAVEMLLADEAWREWSDRKIAEVASVDHSTVSRIKGELSQNNSSSQPETTLGRDGKRRHKPKPRRPKIPTPTFIDDEPVHDTQVAEITSVAEPLTSDTLDKSPPDRILWLKDQLRDVWARYETKFGLEADWTCWLAANEHFAIEQGQT
jgi:hypothetical protein